MVSTEDDEPTEGKGAKIALRQLVKDTVKMVKPQVSPSVNFAELLFMTRAKMRRYCT